MNYKGYTYFLTNKSNRVLYVGVTKSLMRRLSEHKAGSGSSFASKYNCTKLVYYEVFPDIGQAIVREKQIKHFNRDWKNQLVNRVNPEWKDLSVMLVADPEEMPGQAGHDREEAGHDREEAGHDREEAGHDREEARHDREEARHDREEAEHNSE